MYMNLQEWFDRNATHLARTEFQRRLRNITMNGMDITKRAVHWREESMSKKNLREKRIKCVLLRPVFIEMTIQLIFPYLFFRSWLKLIPMMISKRIFYLVRHEKKNKNDLLFIFTHTQSPFASFESDASWFCMIVGWNLCVVAYFYNLHRTFLVFRVWKEWPVGRIDFLCVWSRKRRFVA